jgi:hypothetical protein
MSDRLQFALFWMAFFIGSVVAMLVATSIAMYVILAVLNGLTAQPAGNCYLRP